MLTSRNSQIADPRPAEGVSYTLLSSVSGLRARTLDAAASISQVLSSTLSFVRGVTRGGWASALSDCAMDTFYPARVEAGADSEHCETRDWQLVAGVEGRGRKRSLLCSLASGWLALRRPWRQSCSRENKPWSSRRRRRLRRRSRWSRPPLDPSRLSFQLETAAKAYLLRTSTAQSTRPRAPHDSLGPLVRVIPVLLPHPTSLRLAPLTPAQRTRDLVRLPLHSTGGRSTACLGAGALPRPQTGPSREVFGQVERVRYTGAHARDAAGAGRRGSGHSEIGDQAVPQALYHRTTCAPRPRHTHHHHEHSRSTRVAQRTTLTLRASFADQPWPSTTSPSSSTTVPACAPVASPPCQVLSSADLESLSAVCQVRLCWIE